MPENHLFDPGCRSSRYENVTAGDGWAVEDPGLWSPSGALVAVARQLSHLSGRGWFPSAGEVGP